MKRCTLGIYLLAAMAAFALPAMARAPKNHEVDPDTLRVLWADEAHQVPSFIPQALIGDLDLTSPETVDLSHLPMTQGQKASFKRILFYKPTTTDGCLPSPIVVHMGAKEGSLSAIALLGNERLVSSGTVRKVIPGWLTSVSMPVNLVFFEVGEIFRDLDYVSSTGETLIFIQQSGAELIIDGKRICSPKTGVFQLSKGDTVLLFGFAAGPDTDKVIGGGFEIRDSAVYPDPGSRFLKNSDTEPIPLSELRKRLESFAGLDQ